jgi:hypothetical protein
MLANCLSYNDFAIHGHEQLSMLTQACHDPRMRIVLGNFCFPRVLEHLLH